MSLEKLFSELLSPKGIISMISFVFVVFILMLVLTQLQNSLIGQNPEANKTLESTKQTLGIFTFGYFLIDNIKGILLLLGIIGAIVGVIIYFYKKHNDYY